MYKLLLRFQIWDAIFDNYVNILTLKIYYISDRVPRRLLGKHEHFTISNITMKIKLIKLLYAINIEMYKTL